MRAERDNYRLALQWSITCGEAEEALRLAVALVWYWYVRADFSEGRRWLERALEVGEDASPEIRALAMSRAGIFAITQRDSRRGMALAEEALEALYEVENLREAGWVLYHLGHAAMQQSDFEQAARRYAESTDMFRQIGYEAGVASLLMYQGVVACYQRDHERAAALLEEGLPMLRELGDDMAVARALHGLGLMSFHQADFELATTHFKEGLAAAGRIGARLELAQLLEGLAAVLCQQGHFRRSCVLLGFSEQLRDTISTPLSTAERADYERCLSAIRANLEAEVFADAWAQGQGMAVEEAVAYALGGRAK
jgi:non-specific serine/threonine protein kinase